MIYNRQSIHIAVLLWGCIFSLLTAVCLVLSSEVEQKKKKILLCMQLSCALLMGSDAAAWAFRGNLSAVGWWIVRISNFAVFFFSDVILLLYHAYVCNCLFEQQQSEDPGSGGLRVRLVPVIGILAMVLVIVSQFIHLYYYIDVKNIYHRQPAHFFAMVLPMTGGLLDLTLLIQYRKNISREMLAALISYLVLPLAASFVQIFFYGISYTNIAIGISVILMFLETMIVQNRRMLEQEKIMAEQKQRITQQKLELTEQEKQLTQRRVAAMMSQMRSHFIFNVLATISGYCKIDPEKADQALIQFARYLRRNIRFLEEEGTVSFTTEVEQLDDYVALQQMRFPDRVRYEKDLKEKEFRIPPLTIQPLVENAIKHGIVEADRSGTVRLTVSRDKDGIRIEVTDNGAGFEQKELEKKESVGIRNVRYRLEKMINATMKIDSQPGHGTRVVIQIPQSNGETGL